MTRTSSARLAGLTYLLYIAVALPGAILMGRATRGEGIAAQLASVGAHSGEVRVAIILSLASCFAAIVLGVALYGVTRVEDRELATLGLACRVGEGVIGAIIPLAARGLVWLAEAPAAGSVALGGFLLKLQGWNPIVGAAFFAVGSTAFCWLLLRGRMIPAALAWLGVAGSALLAIVLPLQLAGVLTGLATRVVWIPVALFEVVAGTWLLIKGVPAPADRSA